MSYYWFNRQEILQKAKERYSKEKTAKYYMQNKEVIKEKSRNRYKDLSEEVKNKYLSLFTSSTYPLALSIHKYKGFTLLTS